MTLIYLNDSDNDGVKFFVSRLEELHSSVRLELRDLTARRQDGVMWRDAMLHIKDSDCMAMLVIDNDQGVIGWALTFKWTSRYYAYFFLRKDFRRLGIGSEMVAIIKEYLPRARVYWNPGDLPSYGTGDLAPGPLYSKVIKPE